jgi:TPR repeat protein
MNTNKRDFLKLSATFITSLSCGNIGEEQGDADIQYILFLLYFSGKGVPKDHRKAIEWLVKSAEQGNEKAKRKLKFV